jgi:uncharacterized protein
MSRLIFFLAIAVVVYLLVKSYRKNATGKNGSGVDEAVAEDMVRCAHCGVHLPKGESVQADAKYFCSAGHRDAYRK